MDAAADAPPLSKGDYNRSVSALSGGGRMLRDLGSAPVKTRRPYLFRLLVQDASVRPARDMPLYMGILGHAAFVRTDFTVFAHVRIPDFRASEAERKNRDRRFRRES
jgi:hypothetical protein